MTFHVRTLIAVIFQSNIFAPFEMFFISYLWVDTDVRVHLCDLYDYAFYRGWAEQKYFTFSPGSLSSCIFRVLWFPPVVQRPATLNGS